MNNKNLNPIKKISDNNIIEDSQLNILKNKNSVSNLSYKSKILSEYKQFNKLLDYYVIYQLIKDVSLLKLFCLNSFTSYIFYKYRHKKINISSLDNIMEKETRNNNRELTDFNTLFFDNINEKTHILNSFG